ncbi:MAG: hypothetical protein KAR25_07195 [Methanosarcinales archaeon]|nr:hypothetical protein [Methanosarcinales archaeon]
MVYRTNDASGNIQQNNIRQNNTRQNRTVPSTAPDRLLQRVCMFTILLLYTVMITNRSSGCDYTTIQAAANAANEDE